MPETPAGQRAAQTPARAAVAVSRALGKAAAGGGSMSGVITVRLYGKPAYRIHAGEDGGEVRTCLVTGITRPEGRQGAADDA